VGVFFCVLCGEEDLDYAGKSSKNRDIQ
jgi:hypothetical protein